MATIYQVFRKGDTVGYIPLGEHDAPSPKKALDLAMDGRTAGDRVGEFLVVPKTNATYMRRRKVESVVTEEYDPAAPDADPQEVLT